MTPKEAQSYANHVVSQNHKIRNIYNKLLHSYQNECRINKQLHIKLQQRDNRWHHKVDYELSSMKSHYNKIIQQYKDFIKYGGENT